MTNNIHNYLFHKFIKQMPLRRRFLLNRRHNYGEKCLRGKIRALLLLNLPPSLTRVEVSALNQTPPPALEEILSQFESKIPKKPKPPVAAAYFSDLCIKPV